MGIIYSIIYAYEQGIKANAKTKEDLPPRRKPLKQVRALTFNKWVAMDIRSRHEYKDYNDFCSCEYKNIERRFNLIFDEWVKSQIEESKIKNRDLQYNLMVDHSIYCFCGGDERCEMTYVMSRLQKRQSKREMLNRIKNDNIKKLQSMVISDTISDLYSFFEPYMQCEESKEDEIKESWKNLSKNDKELFWNSYRCYKIRRIMSQSQSQV